VLPASSSVRRGPPDEPVSPKSDIQDARHRSRMVGVVAVLAGVLISALQMPPMTASSLSLPTGPQSSVSLQRFSGTNINWLGWNENLKDGAGGFASHATILRALRAAKSEGFSVVRCQTCGVSVGRHDAIEPRLCSAVGGKCWNEAAFKDTDYAIHEAYRLGIKLVIPLTDESRWTQGGKWVFVHWAAQARVPGVMNTVDNTEPSAAHNTVLENPTERVAEDQFYTNPTIIGYFETYIKELLTHVDRYFAGTKTTWADAPSILGYEDGNELYDDDTNQVGHSPSWLPAIVSLVHSLAPQDVFIDGSVGNYGSIQYAAGLGLPGVKWIDVHYYGDEGMLSADAATLRVENAADALNQHLYVGEYDWPDISSGDEPLSAFLGAVEANSDVIGSSPWDLLPIVNGKPECHGDGYSFYIPAEVSNCENTPSEAVQAQAETEWVNYAAELVHHDSRTYGTSRSDTIRLKPRQGTRCLRRGRGGQRVQLRHEGAAKRDPASRVAHLGGRLQPL
jgi:hypothetical protein